jgi:SAM-dependent methyltransferase
MRVQYPIPARLHEGTALACVICGGTERAPVPHHTIPGIAELRRARGLGDVGWGLCMRCGNATPDEPADLGILDAYWQTNRAAHPDSEAQWAYRERIALIGAERSWETFAGLNGGKIGRFLDVGCGLGVTVKRFQDGGWTATGIDPDATLRPWFEKQGIEAVTGQVEQQQGDGAFDLVQVAYAVYFIQDPRGFLAGLRRIIAPGGHLAIVMADLLAFTQPTAATDAHSFVPTIESLERLLALAGYRVVLKRRIKDSWFVAATPGDVAPPAIDTAAILRRHRTRALRWRLIGYPYALARQLAARVLGASVFKATWSK